MRPLVHFFTGPNRTLCGKSFWGISDSEGASPDRCLVNCPACLTKLAKDQAA